MVDKLELRKIIKGRKPNFLRQDAHVKSKLKDTWRQPKGLHSKMRRKLNSYRKMPMTGYCAPKEVRGLDKSGLNSIRVLTLKDFEGLDVKKDGILIGKVGKKKRLELLKKALELKFAVLNVKDVQEFISKVEEEMKKKKDVAKSKEEKKKKSKAEALKKAEEKKKEEEKKEEPSVDEKAMKDEKRKVLEGKNETY